MRRRVYPSVLILFGLLGCTDSGNWFGSDRAEKKPASSGNAQASRRPSQRAPQKTAPTTQPSRPEDDVYQRVRDYASGFEADDFNAKIARQSDPTRRSPARTVRMLPPLPDEDSETAETPPASGDSAHPDKTTPAQPTDEPPSVADDGAGRPADTAGPISADDGLPRIPDLGDEPEPSPPSSAEPEPATDSTASPGDQPPITPPEPVAEPSPTATGQTGEIKPAQSTIPRGEEPADLTGGQPDSASARPNTGREPIGVSGAAETAPDSARPSERTSADRPPVLTAINVDAGSPASAPIPPPATQAAQPAEANPTVETPATPSAPPKPTIDDVIREREEAVAKSPNDIEQQLSLRMLYLANGQDDKALADAPGMNAEYQEILRGLVRSLISARSSLGRDPALWANEQLKVLDQLRETLRSKADLAIPVVALCDRVESYGNFRPIEPAEFPAGRDSQAVLYVEVAQFRTDRTGRGEYRTLMSMRTSLLSKDGRELWSAHDANIEDVARSPRHDFFLIRTVSFPATLTPGEYVLRVEIEDKLAGKVNSRSLDFKIVLPRTGNAPAAH